MSAPSIAPYYPFAGVLPVAQELDPTGTRVTNMTLVLNLESGKIVWVGDGRYESTLSDFFSDLTEEQRNSIEAIAVDMSPPYRHDLDIWCPHAAIVYDFFHIVAKYGTEVIDVIRSQQAKLHTARERKFVKGSRFLLLRNQGDLDPDERTRLDALFAVNEPLAIDYMLKDQLKNLWTYKVEGWAQPLSAKIK